MRFLDYKHAYHRQGFQKMIPQIFSIFDAFLICVIVS
jgi:hypothetical protein